MKTLRYITCMIFVVGMVTSLLLNCLAATKANETIVIDDKTNNSDRYNASSGFTAITTEKSYNKNAHIHKLTSEKTESNYFEWGFSPIKTSNSPITVKLYAYLYYGAFTDENAKYLITDRYTSNTMLQEIGSLNQNTAITGWNVIGTYTTSLYELLSNGDKRYSVKFARVMPGDGLTSLEKYCGADAVRFEISY